MSYQSKKVNSELKALVSSFNEGFKAGTSSSREKYIRSLPSGSKIPGEGKFYDKEHRDTFARDCEKLQQQARTILGTQLDDIRKKATAAPSSEAVNSINLLSMRKNITKAEVDDMLQTYGDNVQAYRTIVDIAGDHGLHVWDRHPIEQQAQGIEDLANTLNRSFTVTSAENGHAGDGFCSILNSQIDMVFSAE